MTFRKLTIDSSVRYISKTEQPKEREIKPKKKLVQFLVTKTKLFHKTVKFSWKMLQRADLQ